MQRANVVLPDPDWPTRATTSRGGSAAHVAHRVDLAPLRPRPAPSGAKLLVERPPRRWGARSGRVAGGCRLEGGGLLFDHRSDAGSGWRKGW